MSRLVSAHYQLPFSQFWGSGQIKDQDETALLDIRADKANDLILLDQSS